MSMSQANAALVMDVYAETARLGITLTEAERIVDQSTKRMEKKVDGSFGQVGNKITRMLSAAVGAGLAIKVVDDALRKVAEGIENSQGVAKIGEAIANGIVESVRSIPIAGGLMDIASQLSNKMLGDPMGRNKAIADAQEFMRQQEQLRTQGVDIMGQLELQGASPEMRARAERAQEVARLRALAQGAVAGRVETYTDERGNVRERELEPGIRARANELVAQGLRLYDEKVAARTAQEIEKVAQERKRAEERAAADEEARIRAQEDAFERFVQGNAREAILAIESQVAAMSASMAPSRSQRLASLMQDGGLATADTVLGGFTYALGDAATVSQNILANAEQQLATLERIEKLTEEANRIAEESGLR